MVVSAAVFWLARPVFTRFIADDDYVRRRNLWLALTASAFLIPNFWAYMAVAAVLIALVARKDSNPAALYLFLFLVVPPFEQAVTGFGIVNFLFPLDHFGLLSLALIVPAAVRLRRQALQAMQPRTWLAADVLLVSYALLQVAVMSPNVPFTGTIRGVFMAVLVTLLPYYVISRTCTTRRHFVDAVASFVLPAIVLAPLAVFETAKGWLLYSEVATVQWGIDPNLVGYLMREGALRAQLTSGQSIVLGYFYAVVLGLWLYLQADVPPVRRWLATAAVVGGLLAAYSRGPWVGAAVVLTVFFAVHPNARRRFPQFIGVAVLVSTVLVLSPMGGWVIDRLPFIGSIDEGNIIYRQAVNERSLLLIQQNPFFGSPYFTRYMEDLRTGQGIIDLLNVYLTVAMNYGLVTLAAFIAFLGSAGIAGLRAVRRSARVDEDTARLGASLVAAFAGALMIIMTASAIGSIPYIYTSLAALLVAFARVPLSAQEPAWAPQEEQPLTGVAAGYAGRWAKLARPALTPPGPHNGP
jgi:hypothetical protein